MADAASQLLIKIGADVDDALRKMRSVQRELKSTAEEANGVDPAFKRAGDSVKTAGEHMKMAGDHADHFSMSLGSMFKMMAMFSVVMAVFNGISAVFKGLTDAAIGFNSTLEQSKAGWTTLLGGAEQARAMMQDIKNFAVASPFDYQQVEKVARQIKAMGFETEKVMPLMTDISNATSALGLGAPGIEAIGRALGQMHTTGRLNAQDMLQLTSAGVPAWEILSKAIGKTVEQTRDLSEQGKVAGDVMVAAFSNFVRSNWGDAMQKQQLTFTGAMSAIKDSLLFAGSTAFKPLFDAISSLAQRIGNFVQTDAFAQWADRVAGYVAVLTQALGYLAGGFMQVVGALTGMDLNLAAAQMGQVNDAFKLAPEPLQLTGEAAVDAGEKIKTAMAGAVQAAQDRVQALKDTLQSAKDAIANFLKSPLEGEAAFADKIFGNEQEIKRLQLRLRELAPNQQAARQNFPEIRATDARIKQLQDENEKLKTQQSVQYDPLHRQLQQAAEPVTEVNFEAALAGIKAAREQIGRTTPEIDAAEKALKDLQRQQQAANAAAPGTGGQIGVKPAAAPYPQTTQGLFDKLRRDIGPDSAAAKSMAQVMVAWKEPLDKLKGWAEETSKKVIEEWDKIKRSFSDYGVFQSAATAIDSTNQALSSVASLISLMVGGQGKQQIDALKLVFDAIALGMQGINLQSTMFAKTLNVIVAAAAAFQAMVIGMNKGRSPLDAANDAFTQFLKPALDAYKIDIKLPAAVLPPVRRGEEGPGPFRALTMNGPNAAASSSPVAVNVNMGGVTVTDQADEGRLAQRVASAVIDALTGGAPTVAATPAGVAGVV